MRLLFVINSLHRGGAELNLVRRAARFRRQGVDIEVVSLAAGDRGVLDEAERGGIVPRFGLPGFMRAFATRERFDVVEGWMYAGAAVATLFRLRGVPVTWSLRHVPGDLALESRNTRRALGVLKRLAPPARIHVNSTAAIAAHRALGIEGDYRVICNGIDTERFRPCVAGHEAVRTQLGIAPDDRLILHAARFHPHKGHAIVIDAFAALAAVFPRAHLVCVGDATEHVEALAVERRVARVHALPAVDDLAPFYAACDVLVSPSLTESFPTVVAEAMSCARACVATDVGDTTALVADTGIVVRAASVESLAQGLRAALGWSTQERAERGARARTRIIERYGEAAATNAHLESLRELIGRER